MKHTPNTNPPDETAQYNNDLTLRDFINKLQSVTDKPAEYDIFDMKFKDTLEYGRTPEGKKAIQEALYGAIYGITKTNNPKNVQHLIPTAEKNIRNIASVFSSFTFGELNIADKINTLEGVKELEKTALAIFDEYININFTANECNEDKMLLLIDEAKKNIQKIFAINPTTHPKQTNKKQLALSGVVTKLDNKGITITDKHFMHALSPLENNFAYIQQLDDDFIASVSFDEKSGTLTYKHNHFEIVQLVKGKKQVKELDLPLLRTFYKLIFENISKGNSSTVEILLPTLAAHLGIDIRSSTNNKTYNLMNKITSFDNVIGVFQNNSFIKLLFFHGYYSETNTIKFSSPFIENIIKELDQANTGGIQKGKKIYNRHYHSFLTHSTIASERNKSAIEIVNSIITLIFQRGTKKIPTTEVLFKHDDKQPPQIKKEIKPLKAHKKIISIVQANPLLLEQLENANTSNKNNILKRAFTKAYELLKTKTDVYKYFINLKITEIIPTVSTTNQILYITHEGINPDYKS